MRLAAERALVVEYCRRMDAAELTVGTSGNLSVRAGDLVAVTPSGVAYDELTPESVCVVDLDGRAVDGALVASSELPMHTAVYRRTDAAAVVHTHPLYACTLSTVVDELPAIHYMVAQLGGPVRVALYATYGSPELAENAVTALADRTAVLLRSHGATTYGRSLREAYERSVLLEWLCRLYHQACQLGTPRLIPDDELARVTALLAGYGQAGPPTDAGGAGSSPA